MDACVSKQSYLCALGGNEKRGKSFLNATNVYVDILRRSFDSAACRDISQMIVGI